MPAQHPNSNRRFSIAFVAAAIMCLLVCDNSALAQSKREAPIQLGQKSPAQKQVAQSPRGRVRIIIQANQLILTGSKEDIKIVKQAIILIQQKMKVVSNPIISERVALKFQMADVVVALMDNMMDSKITGPPVKVKSLHFPESVLLVGPQSSVKQAKELLATIDSYEWLKGTAQKSRPNIPRGKRIF